MSSVLARSLLPVATTLARIALAVPLGPGDEPPTEFRIFAGGWNETQKGRFLFDEQAASAVMAAYEQWGIDLPIDLEHQMLADTPSPDPTAKDSRGSFNLELRDDGSLWAVNVKWTADGAARLREKRQRYISPAFNFDKNRRPTEIVNVAITSLPATNEAPALVAASRTARDMRTKKLSTGTAFSDLTRMLCEALSKAYPREEGPYCPSPWVVDVFNASVVYELDGKLYEATYTVQGSAVALGTATEVRRTYSPINAVPPAPALNSKRTAKLAAGGTMDPKLVQAALEALIAGNNEKCAEILKGLVVAAAGGEAPAAPPADPNAAASENSATPPQAPEDKQQAAAGMAAARLAMVITGKSNAAEAMAELAQNRTVAIAVEQERAKLAKDRETLEQNERVSIYGKLVTEVGKAPASVWKDADKKEPKAYLAKMSLEELREHLAEELKARGENAGAAWPGLKPPPVAPTAMAGATGASVPGLTPEQLAICKELGADPKDFAALRALNSAAS